MMMMALMVRLVSKEEREKMRKLPEKQSRASLRRIISLLCFE